jgi:hypothetical protein
MTRNLTRDARTRLARVLGHAWGFTRRYAGGERLVAVLASALYAGRDPRPARAVLHKYGAEPGGGCQVSVAGIPQRTGIRRSASQDQRP